MLKNQKLFITLLVFASLGFDSNLLAWGDYASGPDYEMNISNSDDVVERNIARDRAEKAQHDRVRDWGKKSLKDRLSSISLFRNREHYLNAAHDGKTVSLSEALKFTFGKSDRAADKSIVDYEKTKAAQETVRKKFERNATERVRQEHRELQEKALQQKIKTEKTIFENDLKSRYDDILDDPHNSVVTISREKFNDVIKEQMKQYDSTMKTIEIKFQRSKDPDLTKLQEDIVNARRVLRNQFYEKLGLKVPESLKKYSSPEIIKSLLNLSQIDG